MSTICRGFTAFLMAVASLTASPGELFGQGRHDTIAQTGQVAPDGNGTFSYLGAPVLNSIGQAAFRADLIGTSGGSGSDDTGIFLGNGGSLGQIARRGQAAPDANGTFSDLFGPTLNDSGQAAFRAFLVGTSGGGSDNSGIFRGGGGSITQIAREGQAAPDGNGAFSTFLGSAINNAGQVAYRANLTGTSGGNADNMGIFRGIGGSVTQIARKGQLAPDANGVFSSFGTAPVLNNAGEAAFFADLTGTSGGSLDNRGIFRGSGGILAQIARAGQLAPDANGRFSSFVSLTLNDSGQAAFNATLTDTSGGFSDNGGIFRGNGSTLTQIARGGQLAPDGNGTFSSFSGPSINNSGQVVFSAGLTGTLGGTSDHSGLFLGGGGSVTQIAREGQLTPDGNGAYSSFLNRALNNAGQVAYRATLTGTIGGNNDDHGIFTSDGIDVLQVVREGASLNGFTITGLTTSSSSTNAWLNDHGQIGYQATLSNGDTIVRRWTPNLHWRTTFSSNWDVSARWTLGLNPAFVHDVFIDPNASLTVTGPAADTTVRSLQIGGGSGLATLNLRSGARLTTTNGVLVESTGTLTGDGTIAGTVTNHGTILANNLTFTNTLTNHHVIRGSGRIDANIVNSSSGKIRTLNGAQLWLSGRALENRGLVEINDSELQVDGLVFNDSSTGLISLRNGSLVANSGIVNKGSIAMTLGASTIHGDIDNTSIIQISGGAHATFFDDVIQNGTLQVASVGHTNSTAVFLGEFSGSGGFVGGGDVFALGDLRPGNSPDRVLYDGNLFLGTTTDTFIELGGLGLGEFDQMIVTGDLNLGGDLFVSLIDGHALGLNQSYLIGDIGGDLFGQFNGLNEGDLVGTFGGMDLFISYGAGSGNGIALFTAVPEPSSAVLIGMLLAGYAVLHRQRKDSKRIVNKASVLKSRES